MSDRAWFVYIVRCADRTLYTGIARDPEARIEKHNAGCGARYTRGRRPVEMVYLERVVDRAAALRRELAIKRMETSAKRRLIGMKTA
ncbi:MAG: GIY-YIG nuclease family protein [Gammaproteobacteria bacterium]